MIRRYRAGDELQIGQIFYDAIHHLASKDYTPEQLNAWAPGPPDRELWRLRCESKQPFVKVLQGRVVGFIELDRDGHVDCTYVDPTHSGVGVMSEIMLHVKRAAIEMQLLRLFAEVSKTARPFFERHGFVWVRDNLVTRRGVSLENFIMECDLNAEATGKARQLEN